MNAPCPVLEKVLQDHGVRMEALEHFLVEVLEGIHHDILVGKGERGVDREFQGLDLLGHEGSLDMHPRVWFGICPLTPTVELLCAGWPDHKRQGRVRRQGIHSLEARRFVEEHDKPVARAMWAVDIATELRFPNANASDCEGILGCEFVPEPLAFPWAARIVGQLPPHQKYRQRGGGRLWLAVFRFHV
jgi:hypothetical protein